MIEFIKDQKAPSIQFLKREIFAGPFFNDKKAQLSAELIIILAAVVAIAALVIVQLRKTTNTASEKVDSKTEDIFNDIDQIGDYN